MTDHPLFSLRYQHPTATNFEQTRIEGWLQRWGTAYLRDITWRAYDPSRDESFRFRLDFVIFPVHGRKPSDYLLLELISPQSDLIAQRDAARRQLLRVLWPGQMLCLGVQLLRTDAEAAQLRILEAMS